MARGPSRQDLYLQVSGSVEPLNRVLKTGKTALLDFAGDATKQLEAVEKALEGLGNSGGAASAQALTRGYEQAFREIRRNAEQVLGAPSGADALNVVNLNAAREAVRAAEGRATALRQVATAAQAAAVAEGSQNQQLVQYAAAALVAARDSEQHVGALRQQAAALELVEGNLTAAGARMTTVTKQSGAARAGMQQLAMQFGDIATQASAGTPPIMIFAMQISQVTSALALMAGEGKGFIGFMGGPWPQVIAAAAVVLTPLVSKLWEKTEAEKEAEKAAKDHAEAVDSLVKSLDRAVLSAEAKLRQDYIMAEGERRKAIAIRETNRALLEQAKAQFAAARSQNFGAAGGAGAGMAQAIYADRVGDVEAEIAKNDAALAKLEKAAGQAASLYVKGIVEAMSTPEGRLRRAYQLREDAALAEAQASKDYGKYARTLALINAERERELKALQESNRKKGSGGAPAEERATPNLVSGILKGAFGGTITSTTGGKHVAGSYHYKGQAVDFVPAGGMGSVTKAQVRAALEAQGVQIKELLGPGDKGHSDHFHVAFARARQSRAAIEKAAEQQRQRELTEDISFGEQERRAKTRLLDALGKSAVSEEQREQLLRQEIEAEASAEARKIGLQLSKGDRSEAEAARLLAINEETRQARLAAIGRGRMVAENEKALERMREEVSQSDGLLRAQLQIADTREDRARIERKLLDNSYKIESAELAIELASALAAKDWERYAIAIGKAANMAERKAADDEDLRRGARGDYEVFRDELGTAEALNQQIDDFKIDSIRQLRDELADAATKALGLTGALGDVVGALIRIGIERKLLGPAADFLFGPAGGGAGGGLFGKLFGFLGFADGGRPDRAVNGRITGPGTGRSDSILALLNGTDPILVSNGESIVNAEATQRYWPLIDAMNRGQLPKFADGGFVGNLPRSVTRIPANDVIQSLNGRAADGLVRVQLTLSDDLDARIDNRAANVAVEVTRAAAPAIKQAAVNDTFAAMGRPGM